MTRLIDADALENEVDAWCYSDFDKFDFLEAIDNAPTVEINTNDIEYKAYCKGLEDGKKIARPKGKWIRLNNTSKRSYRRMCNKCHNIAYFCGEGNYPNCPYCLAEMEADNEISEN